MRKIILLPVIIMLAAAAAFSQDNAPEKKYIVAGVAFYNLENLFDTINDNGKYDYEFTPEGPRMWTSERYWKKIGNLSRAIASLSTPETPVGPAWGLRIVHHDSPDLRGIDVALLYNPLFFEVGNVVPHRLVIPDDPDFITRDQLCVSGSLLDVPVSFIVNHWPSRLGGQAESSPLREAAGRLSRCIADSLWSVNPDQGIVMMGDLNDDPFDKSCAESFGAVRDQDKVTAHGFYNPFWYILDNGVGTLCYKGVWNLFDQIIVSGNLVQGLDGQLQYWKCTVINKPFLRTKTGVYKNYPKRTYAGGRFLNGYSDHFPTQIFLLRSVD